MQYSAHIDASSDIEAVSDSISALGCINVTPRISTSKIEFDAHDPELVESVRAVKGVRSISDLDEAVEPCGRAQAYYGMA